jgi:hypothetical protein
VADVERIAPPVPTLPAPVGRNVDGKRRRPAQSGEQPERDAPPPESPDPQTPSDHIDEYA